MVVYVLITKVFSFCVHLCRGAFFGTSPRQKAWGSLALLHCCLLSLLGCLLPLLSYMVELSNLVDVKPYCLKTFVWDFLRFLRILSTGWQLHLDAGCCRGLYRFTQHFSNYRWLQRCVREWVSVPLLFRVFVPWTWFILLLQCRSEGMSFFLFFFQLSFPDCAY